MTRLEQYSPRGRVTQVRSINFMTRPSLGLRLNLVLFTQNKFENLKIYVFSEIQLGGNRKIYLFFKRKQKQLLRSKVATRKNNTTYSHLKSGEPPYFNQVLKVCKPFNNCFFPSSEVPFIAGFMNANPVFRGSGARDMVFKVLKALPNPQVKDRSLVIKCLYLDIFHHMSLPAKLHIAKDMQ